MEPSGAPIYALIADYHISEGNLEQVAADYRCSVEEVQAALDYYEQHQFAIDFKIDPTRF